MIYEAYTGISSPPAGSRYIIHSYWSVLSDFRSELLLSRSPVSRHYHHLLFLLLANKYFHDGQGDSITPLDLNYRKAQGRLRRPI